MIPGNVLTSETVSQAFLAATPKIAEQILDKSIKTPLFMRDMYETEAWDLGSGTTMEQLEIRSTMPTIETDFSKWKRLEDNTGCNPCAGPDCNYNWTVFGGHSFERKRIGLMHRDFKSPDFCVHKIQTTAHFQEIFQFIIDDLYRQRNWFLEMNIGFLYLTMLAKKFVVDSDGPKINGKDVYSYPNVSGAILSALNINLLEFFYEAIKRTPGTVPYEIVDGNPVYALIAGTQILGRLYRDDPNLRQDVRFSGLANDLVLKYNFMSMIRGMFFPVQWMYPRRFKINAGGEPVQILPFLDDIPGEVGVYTGMNPSYEVEATHEEVIIMGKYPFKIFYLPVAATLGGGTDFGPEPQMMSNWLWINPLTDCDPFRRQGYFATSMQIGLAPQYSEGIFAVLVERPSRGLTFQQNPQPVCPEEPVTCNNSIPATDCPCPILVTAPYADPFTEDTFIYQFTGPVTGNVANVGDTIQLQLDTGATLEGTLAAISADASTVSITFSSELGVGACTNIIGVSCEAYLNCQAKVVCINDCAYADDGLLTLTLTNPISVEEGDTVTVCLADGTTEDGVVSTIVPVGNLYTIDELTSICTTGGVLKVCVPTSTNADCPACSDELTQCSDD